MAWIESHQSLLTHRKLLRVVTSLHEDKYKIIGHLHALWWWSLDNAADDGYLYLVSSEEIAVAAGWPAKRATAFVAALLAAGFLEHVEDTNSYRLHNWFRYAGKLNQKKAKDRARKSTGISGISDGIPVEVARKSQAPTKPTNQPNQPTTPTNQKDAVVVVSGLYENEIGTITVMAKEEILDLVDSYSLDCIKGAFEIAVKANKRSLGYVEGICKKHKAQGSCIDARERAGTAAESNGVLEPVGLRFGSYEPPGFVLDP